MAVSVADGVADAVADAVACGASKVNGVSLAVQLAWVGVVVVVHVKDGEGVYAVTVGLGLWTGALDPYILSMHFKSV